MAGLAVARQASERLAAADAGARPLADRVREVGYLLTDLAGDLSCYLADLEDRTGAPGEDRRAALRAGWTASPVRDQL